MAGSKEPWKVHRSYEENRWVKGRYESKVYSNITQYVIDFREIILKKLCELTKIVQNSNDKFNNDVKFLKRYQTEIHKIKNYIEFINWRNDQYGDSVWY